jgi:Ran GTPase-activating protein 1
MPCRDGVTDVEQIILSTWALSVDAAEVFAGVIAAQTQLKSAILADIIAGRPEAEGLRVYEVLGAALKEKALTEIDLSDNAVGPKGVAALRELLSSQACLQKLYFCNCGISAEAATSLSELLLFRTPTQ